MLRHAALPLVLAVGAVGADGSPIRDVRLGLDVGVGDRTTIGFDTSTTVASTRVDSSPVRWSLGYVRGVGESSTQSPILGVQISYERGGGRFSDHAAATTIGGDRVDTTVLAFDLEAGWAVVVPTAPRFQVEAAVFAGYVSETQDLGVPTSGRLTLAGDGYETGARFSVVHTDASGWQIGASARYLFDRVVDEPFGDGSVRVTQSGMSIGLLVGRRL